MVKLVKGIIVDAGADQVQDPLYDNKLKVRIPELHGWGELVKGFQETAYTKDEYLPWCEVVTSSINTDTRYPILQYKAQTYAPADFVYVQIDDSSPTTEYTVVGLVSKYNEDTSDPSLTAYNNIDVSTILENKTDFPEGLINPSGNSPSIDDSDSDSSGGTGQDGEGADNTISDWKYVFGYPFAEKQNVSCPFGKPGDWAAGKHTGIDLSGSIGTAIYAVGDGVVVTAASGHSSYGNYVIISHGGLSLWTLYAHMNKSPLVSSGAKVKGTQLVADTEPTKAYKKLENQDTYEKLTSKPANWDSNYGTYWIRKGTGKKYQQNTSNDWELVKNKIFEKKSGQTSYQLLTKEPKDWKYGGWKNYYKNTGTAKNPKYTPVEDKKQKGTQLGVRGSTGNSSGPHLHFEFRKGSNSYYSFTDPNKYISF